MEERYSIQDNPFDNSGAFPILSPLTISRLNHYNSRALENVLMTGIDMQCNQLICSRAIAAHVNVTAVAVQASALFPEAADRFHALAEQNFICLSKIISDSARRR